ncbi:MAG: hypothetical protein ABFD96_13990 [Armatimonadia bacterium]
MHISDLQTRVEAGRARVEAWVTWEDAAREPLRLFLETDARFADALWADPNGLAVAALLPAWHAGERRLLVDGTLCPILRDNLKAACETLRAWYPESGPPPALETSQGFKPRYPAQGQAVSFLSGGIDSLATLRSNKLCLPPDHPGAIRASILVDVRREPGLSEEETARQHAKRVAVGSAVAAEAGIEAISVKTNLLQLDGDGWFFSFRWHGAVFAATSHLLGKRFAKAYIASSYTPALLHPWGSHPLLDPYYSAGNVRIEHHGLHMSRFEKVELVADWPVGLQNILVCQGHDSGETNCGACEKCIRTMTALVACGKLQECQAFPLDDVSPELLRTVQEYDMIWSETNLDFYDQMIPALTDRGRDDLVEVIQGFRLWLASKHESRGLTPALLAQALPVGAQAALVDWGHPGCFAEPERSGRYWGMPPDDTTAVRELEALREAGADYLVFGPETFWWLDYYSQLGAHLRSKYKCIQKDKRCQVFDLRVAPD